MEQINKEILRQMEGLLGNTTTYSNDLEKIGKQLFGNKFRGVFSSDTIPKMKDGDMAIVNVDTSDMPGSHWTSIVVQNGDTYFYDSFGRKAEKLIPSLLGLGKPIKEDKKGTAEQKVSQKDCGQRSLAWLLIYENYGPEKALQI
jgi:hypothetical protein